MKIVFLCIVYVGGICIGIKVVSGKQMKSSTGSFVDVVLQIHLPVGTAFPTLGRCSLFSKLKSWRTYTRVPMPCLASPELALDRL